ncbi:peritrophin-1 [Drosophila teissieri]|uniref:peritrophin-1 n=1 Tax=Drosophila teissieri TaxID=7243 RepID=UPI001CBA3882|nr:peritrophin-1 [Drosophila teissieri]
MLNRIPLTVTLCALFFGCCMPQAVKRWPYPNDCHRYYERRLFDCPPQFNWNPQLQQCDFQTPTGCFPINSNPNWNNSDPSSPAITEPENPDLQKLCENKLNQLIPYPGNCSQYIQCDYLPFVMPCPQYLFWNSQLLTCDKICISGF